MPRGIGRSGIAWIGIGCGVLWAASNGVDVLSVAESSHWPTAAGVVTASAVRPETLGVTMFRGGRVSLRIEDRLHVAYEYTIAGQRYTGTRFNILIPSTGEARARVHLRHAYPVGEAIEVRYDPDDRATAVLDTAIPSGRVFNVILGLVVAIGAWAATRPREGRT
jgi:hypothetical protein